MNTAVILGLDGRPFGTGTLHLRDLGTLGTHGTKPLAPLAPLAPKRKRERGIAITAVSEHSPASAAGLRPGDLIVEFAGKSVQGIDDLHRLLIEERIGDVVPLRVIRRGELRRLLVTPREVA